jgi:hypothetical protein
MATLYQASPPPGKGKSGDWVENDGIWWFWSVDHWEPGPSGGAEVVVADGRKVP